MAGGSGGLFRVVDRPLRLEEVVRPLSDLADRQLVRPLVRRAIDDRVRIEDHDVGEHSLAQLAAVAEELGQYSSQVRNARAEVRRLLLADLFFVDVDQLTGRGPVAQQIVTARLHEMNIPVTPVSLEG